jgi:hypothetical protein
MISTLICEEELDEELEELDELELEELDDELHELEWLELEDLDDELEWLELEELELEDLDDELEWLELEELECELLELESLGGSSYVYISAPFNFMVCMIAVNTISVNFLLMCSGDGTAPLYQF